MKKYFPLILLASLLTLASPNQSAFAFPALDQQLQLLNGQIDTYQDMVKKGGWPSLQTQTKLEPGTAHSDVAVLREILTMTGDLKSPKKENGFLWFGKNEDPRQAVKRNVDNKNNKDNAAADQIAQKVNPEEFYDSKLLEAVTRFQARHSLETDGIIGPATRSALSVPAEERLAQLMVARNAIDEFNTQHPDFKQGILVNIPGYRLYIVEAGNIAEQMKVIVGQKSRPTPIFSNEITTLEFNPFWYVPNKIAAKDILPKIQNNPSYVENAGFALTYDGEAVDAHNVDWSQFDSGHFPFQLVQRSGNANALGKVKFMLPNNRAIYLHDTSKPHLFKRDYRALSSGCIRVENPLIMTKFVLGYGKGYPAEKSEAVYQSNSRKGITLESPIQVNTVYWTAWVDPGLEQPNFYEDVYNKTSSQMASVSHKIQKFNNL